VWPPFTNPGRTYKFYTGKPVLPFGYGITYSRIQYSIIADRTLSKVSLQQRTQHVLGHITLNVSNVAAWTQTRLFWHSSAPPPAMGGL
jgi:hypothetical protein